jgi:predicted GTPase
MGYSEDSLLALRKTIDAAEVDLVIAGTPIDLARALDSSTPIMRAHYRYQDEEAPGLMGYVDAFLSIRGD